VLFIVTSDCSSSRRKVHDGVVQDKPSEDSKTIGLLGIKEIDDNKTLKIL
jgi:hypothetical protein